MAKRKQKAEETVPAEIVAEAVSEALVLTPGASGREIARNLGVSEATVRGALRRPVTAERIRAKLTQGRVNSHTQGSISAILASLSTIVDDMLDGPGLVRQDDVAELTHLLGALVGTVERLSRAGIDLTRVADPGDTRALRALLRETYGRALTRAIAWGPERSARALRLLGSLRAPTMGHE